jgi:hypothetical protein
MSHSFVRSTFSDIALSVQTNLLRWTALGLVVLFGACSGVAQAPATPLAKSAAVAPVSAGEEQSAPAKDDASNQGIKVHGHWKIVVKNLDGSTVETREFENSLIAGSGSSDLVHLLVVGESSGGFGIDMTTTGTSICPTVHCALAPSSTVGVGWLFCGQTGYTCATGMTQTPSASFNSVVLAGQLTAAQSGTITSVATWLALCNSTFSGATCGANGAGLAIPYAFTSTTVSPISVNSGQIVQVTVTISFS